MKTFLAAFMAVSGSLFFLASAPDAEAGNSYRTFRPVRTSYRPVCRPAYQTRYVSYRPAYRAPYRPVYRGNPYFRTSRTSNVCRTTYRTYRSYRR